MPVQPADTHHLRPVHGPAPHPDQLRLPLPLEHPGSRTPLPPPPPLDPHPAFSPATMGDELAEPAPLLDYLQ